MIELVRNILRYVGMFSDFSPEVIHTAELDNARFEQHRIMTAIDATTSGRKRHCAELRKALAQSSGAIAPPPMLQIEYRDDTNKSH